MSMDIAVRGSSSNNGAEVDANSNLKVNLPVTATQAGVAQVGYVRDASTARVARVGEDGDLFVSNKLVLFKSDFNNPIATTPQSSQWAAEATTQTLAAQAGFYRFNSGAVTTVTTGIQLHSWRTFNIEDGSPLSVRMYLRHTGGAVANKQMDAGLGYAAPATGQGSACNEFVGFRWTTAGTLQGVLEYSTGGAPTSLTVNINGGVPLSDNVARTYEILVYDDLVEFWINDVYQASVATPADNPGILKACGYPLFFRLFNSASPPASAPILDVGDVAVIRCGPGADIPQPIRQVLHGRHCINNQTGLTTTAESTALIGLQTASVPASGTAPTAATGSNTATTLTGLGGFYRANGAAITATQHSNVIVTDYTNPAVPTAAGAGNDVRNLVITDIMISPMVVTTVLAGGGATLEWFVAVGHNAVSLATTTANGTTTAATKGPRILPLPIFDTLAATAAVGTVSTRQGDSSVHLNTPLVVHPGEHIAIGFRVLYSLAAVTSGTLDGGISLSGYWD